MSNLFIGVRGSGGSEGVAVETAGETASLGSRLREPLREPRGGRAPPAGSGAGSPGAALRGECPVRPSPVKGPEGLPGLWPCPCAARRWGLREAGPTRRGLVCSPPRSHDQRQTWAPCLLPALCATLREVEPGKRRERRPRSSLRKVAAFR